ncbi:hypothetical protein TELCIR_07270 [Teladorsagia circumcincta]|uniref:Major facilitator superfamily associated domain-containing protein n=1 Tax=Teladorsagia circumcincta TaxID=45464 RepID=A0A2G9UKV4_TELCI|nr:hypothetical protein TELCIR_07270 [Teladorsagia circumcincta]
MIFFNTIAVGMAGVFCAMIGVVPADYPKCGVALFTLVITCMGMNPGGFYKCGTLSSRQYAHFVLATIQFMKCVALFVAPMTVALFVHDERRHDQWRYVYWINGALLILANFAFMPFATDQPASFTLITRATHNEEKALRNAAKFSATGRDGKRQECRVIGKAYHSFTSGKSDEIVECTQESLPVKAEFVTR